MLEKLNLIERFGAYVQRACGKIEVPGMVEDVNGFIPAGVMNMMHYRNGRAIGEYQFANLVVNEGKQDILNTYFTNGTQIASSSWFMGLIVDTGFTGILATDTAASHSGWNEFTGFSGGARPAWGQVAPSTGITVITNSTPVTFNITSSGNLKGGFIISNSTISGTSGKLWAAALFTSPVPVNNGDQMKCTYNLST